MTETQIRRWVSIKLIVLAVRILRWAWAWQPEDYAISIRYGDPLDDKSPRWRVGDGPWRTL